MKRSGVVCAGAAAVALAGGALAGAAPAMAQPDDVLQSVAWIPAYGPDCSGFVDPRLNWSGVPVTGWGTSWQRWVNEQQGGFVCTRTLTFDNSTQTWTVR